MFERNVARVLEKLAPSDLVLDIGGWALPFNRANYVMDAEPFETRGYYGRPAQGCDTEHFTRETWIQRDICEKTPYPFKDKELDFVICSHTLEDIRDPLFVCSEMMRIAKAGYIEVPSRTAESCRGVESGQVGWSHHRWLIDIEAGAIRFLKKYHRIHSHWRFSLPASYLRALPENRLVQWLFWDDSFEFSETTIHGIPNIEAELERFVEEERPYGATELIAGGAWRKTAGLSRRVVRKVRRTVGGK